MADANPWPDTSLAGDLGRLRELAEARWEDNWNFRAYLRREADPRHVDAAVHRLSAEAAAAIDCLKCGNCCKTTSPHLTPDDVVRAAAACGATAGEYEARYLAPDGEGAGELVFRESPCPMLAGNHCRIYADRPVDCRSFPHLDQPDFLDYSIPAIEHYGTCPIIFNVYERLKQEFAYDPAVDHIGDEPQE